MSSPPRKLIYLALVCSVLFLVGMVQLFLLRFEDGDVYPAYSSRRSGPLGTQALYQSLQRTTVDSVHRNYRPLHQLPMDSNTTLMIIGIREYRFFWGEKKYDKLLENLAQTGGRLVLTFTPASNRRPTDQEENEELEPTRETTESGEAEAVDDPVDDKSTEGDATAGEAADGETTDGESCKEAEERFGSGLSTLGFSVAQSSDEVWDDYADRFYNGDAVLPPVIPWRSPLSFELEDNSWETLYTWQGEPAVVQRPWGEGMVVMVADSYLLSNEALRNHRVPGLLTWLVRPGHMIIFDESLKGLVEQPGMAKLARQYRLHGVFAALLAVAVLFIWRQSAIFIAPVQDEKAAIHTQPAAGSDTSQGLVHLARQHIAAKTLLTICLRAWKGKAGQRVSASRIAEVEAMVAEAAADPRKEKQVKTYIEICELLKQGKRS